MSLREDIEKYEKSRGKLDPILVGLICILIVDAIIAGVLCYLGI